MRKLIATLMMLAAMTPSAQAGERETATLDAPQAYVAVLKKRFPKLDEEHVYMTIGGGDCRGCSFIDFVTDTRRGYCDFIFGPPTKLDELQPIIIKNCRTFGLHDVW